MKTAPLQAKAFGDPAKSKILVIGHDPRLRYSDTVAEFCFFADYYFRPKPTSANGMRKYEFAEALFSYVGTLTDGQYRANEVLLTNLCNEALPSPRSKGTTLIPRDKAEAGLAAIRHLLDGSPVRWIFAMSLQVNYWLQELGFYPPISEFLAEAKPKQSGLGQNPPYYEPNRRRAFLQICGNAYRTDMGQTLFPVLHVKNWPLDAQLSAYEPHYARYMTTYRALSAQAEASDQNENP